MRDIPVHGYKSGSWSFEMDGDMVCCRPPWWDFRYDNMVEVPCGFGDTEHEAWLDWMEAWQNG
jgi:hypothetical protein